MRNAIVASMCLVFASCVAVNAQDAASTANMKINSHRPGGRVVTPASGLARPEDKGLRAHTNYKIFIPVGRPEAIAGFDAVPSLTGSSNPVSGYRGETPESLACLYGEFAWTTGCNPDTLPNSKHAVGGAKAIAIVDAYDYPTAAADLNAYSTQFGLPAITSSNFTVKYQTAVAPSADPNCAAFGGWQCWASEAALDIEMAHSMAPAAHIYLVEANSSSYTDLFAAVTVAKNLVVAAGGGEVSMSFGGGEFSGETAYDSTFTGANVVYFASTGDSEGTEYPSVSPNVVGVGGTTLSRTGAGNIEAETAWEDGGGGYSTYEAIPSYQSRLTSLSGGHRAVPDIAAIGNPRTPVWVYDSFDNGGANWNLFGGTSVASPLWAGVANHAGHFAASTAAEQALIYAVDQLNPALRDVTYGNCGFYDGWNAVSGWDPCTGLGAPYGTANK